MGHGSQIQMGHATISAPCSHAGPTVPANLCFGAVNSLTGAGADADFNYSTSDVHALCNPRESFFFKTVILTDLDFFCQELSQKGLSPEARAT